MPNGRLSGSGKRSGNNESGNNGPFRFERKFPRWSDNEKPWPDLGSKKSEFWAKEEKEGGGGERQKKKERRKSTKRIRRNEKTRVFFTAKKSKNRKIFAFARTLDYDGGNLGGIRQDSVEDHLIGREEERLIGQKEERLIGQEEELHKIELSELRIKDQSID